jgi:hypothetical protein
MPKTNQSRHPDGWPFSQQALRVAASLWWILLFFFSGLQLLWLLRALSQATRQKRFGPV